MKPTKKPNVRVHLEAERTHLRQLVDIRQENAGSRGHRQPTVSHAIQHDVLAAVRIVKYKQCQCVSS